MRTPSPANSRGCGYPEEYVPTSEVMNLGYIAELLYSTKTAEVTYEVKKGDTWSQIAARNDMTSASCWR